MNTALKWVCKQRWQIKGALLYDLRKPVTTT